MYAVTSLSSNRADEITGYVSGITEAGVATLLRNTDVRSVVPVTSVPYTLLSPRQCLDLVSSAERAGLVWHLSPEVNREDELRVSLRVYDAPDADGKPGEKLVDVSWLNGRVVKGHGRMTLAAAKNSVEAAAERRDAA